MKRNRRRQLAEAELDITAFMNLMIVLVPVLLLSLVFSQVTAIDVNLPQGSARDSDDNANQQLELVIRSDSMRVDYPRGILLKRIPKTAEGEQDFALACASKRRYIWLRALKAPRRTSLSVFNAAVWRSTTSCWSNSRRVTQY